MKITYLLFGVLMTVTMIESAEAETCTERGVLCMTYRNKITDVSARKASCEQARQQCLRTPWPGAPGQPADSKKCAYPSLDVPGGRLVRSICR